VAKLAFRVGPSRHTVDVVQQSVEEVKLRKVVEVNDIVEELVDIVHQ
jgi:hypothetical protein